MTEISDKTVDAVALAIHQCHYHPVDWNSKEQLAMFEREKHLAVSKAKAAITALLASGEVVVRGHVDSMQDDIVNVRVALKDVYRATKGLPELMNRLESYSHPIMGQQQKGGE